MTVLTPSSVTVSSSEVGSSASLWDGLADSSHRWRATSNAATVTFDMGTATPIGYYTLVPGMNTVNEDPSAWTFESSPDNSTWTTLDTKSSQSFSTNSARTFAVTGNDRYYKLNVSALAGGGSFHCSLSEMQVGTASAATSIVETQSGTNTGTTTVTATISGTPTATQTVVVSLSADKTAAVTGLGATWTKVRDAMAASASTYTHVVYIGTGASSGTITATAASNFTAQMVVLVVDNLSSPLVYDQAAYNSARTVSNGQLVIGAIYESGGTNVVISGSSTPSSGSYTVGTRYDPTGSIRVNQAWKLSSTETSHNVTWSGLSFAAGDMTVIGMPAVASTSTTYNGDAALTASSTLTIAGFVDRFATATLAATSTLTSGAFVNRPAAASLAATSTLTADGFIGVPTQSASASLTATSTLTSTATAVRSVDATLTATSTLTASANILTQATVTLTATSTLTATAGGAVVLDASAALYAASALFVDATVSSAASATLTASSTLTVVGDAFTPWVEPNDPRTGRPQYRLIVAQRDGTRYAEITNANCTPIEDGVGVGASFNWQMPNTDPKMVEVTPAGRQAQVWRGTGLVFRGPIVTIDEDSPGSTTVKCRDPFWYLESGRRVIGAIPKRDLLVNGSFATGEPPWTGGFAPDSIPAAQPERHVVDVDFFGTQMKALQISGVDKVVTVTQEVKTEAVFVPNSASYLPGGAAAIAAVAQQMPKTGTLQVRVDGYTADNRINGDPGDGMALSKARADAAAATIHGVRPNAVTTTAGYGYYHQIPGGLAANRRVVISWNGVQEASGHKQYEAQTLTVTQPVAKKAPLPLTFVGWTKITKWIGPSADGWGVYIQIVNPAKPTVIVDSAHADIDEKTPRDRWIRMEATVEVPADGIAYQVQVRFYPPAGTALWTRGGLYPGDQLAFFDADQALIIKGLVEHAQDTTIGKGALGIGTRCQPTGLTRTREYPHDERMPIDTAISEIASLYHGPEVVMEVTPTAQTVVTYYPRQGKATSEVLVHGGNVAAYEAPTDTRDAASSIILQADGSGADREEGYASDPAALDGLLLERVISTENETPVTELEEGALHALATYKRPQPAVWVTIDPRRTGAMLGAIGQGDTARLVIERAAIDGTFRFTKRRLHLTDVLEMMFTPEG